MTRTTDGNPAGGERPRRRLDAVREAIDLLERDEDEEGVHVHVHVPQAPAPGARTTDADPGDPPRGRTDDAISQRLDDVEDGMLEMRGTLATILERLPAAGAPPARTADGDSAALQTSFQSMIAQAEILVPGFRAPTFDSALPRAKTVDAMCATRRQVLGALSATAEGAALIGQVAEDGFDVQQSDCAVVATVFRGAAALKGSANNRAATGDRMGVPALPAVVPQGPKVPTEDEINKRNREYWATR